MLTEKGQPFVWNVEQHRAFAELKRRLVSAPILASPRDEDQYVLDTDASLYSLGAVLHQEQDGGLKVIGYGSRLLTKAERNYTTTRREMLAVIYGFKQFRQFLLGRRFLLRVDHSAITYLRQTPEIMGQAAHWLEFIEEYDFDIVHRAGAAHGNCDALSRKPGSETGCDDDCQAEATSAQSPSPAAIDGCNVSRSQRILPEQPLSNVDDGRHDGTRQPERELPSSEYWAPADVSPHGPTTPAEHQPQASADRMSGIGRRCRVTKTAVRQRTAASNSRQSPAASNSRQSPAAINIDGAFLKPTDVELTTSAADACLSASHISAEQRKDLHLAPLIAALEDNKERPPWSAIQSTSEETRALWAQFNSLRLFHDGVLQRAFYQPSGKI
jgi:hypothetical protein